MNNSQKNKYKLIYIEWEDSVSMSSSWKDLEGAMEWIKNANWLVKETGFILKETKEFIFLAGAYQEENENFHNFKKIPKTWIRKRVDLNKYIQ